MYLRTQTIDAAPRMRRLGALGRSATPARRRVLDPKTTAAAHLPLAEDPQGYAAKPGIATPTDSAARVELLEHALSPYVDAPSPHVAEFRTPSDQSLLTIWDSSSEGQGI